MRILFSCHGAYGHFHPIAALALATQDKGHDVVVATGPDLLDWVGACGLRAAPVGLSSGEFPARLAALSVEDRALVMFHRFSTIAVPPTLADLLQLTRSWRPDVVVHEEGEYGAPLFAALRQIPCVTHRAGRARSGLRRGRCRLRSTEEPHLRGLALDRRRTTGPQGCGYRTQSVRAAPSLLLQGRRGIRLAP